MSTSSSTAPAPRPWRGTISEGPRAGHRVHLYDVGLGWHIPYFLEHDAASEALMGRPMDADRLRALFSPAAIAVVWDHGGVPPALASTGQLSDSRLAPPRRAPTRHRQAPRDRAASGAPVDTSGPRSR